MPTIEKLIPNPSKPYAPFVRLLLDDGTAVEFTVRDAHMKTLTTVAKRLAYVLECKEYHSPEGPDGGAKAKARRAAWDADDAAKAKAAADAAKAAEEAKFVMHHVATTAEGVTVSVTWQALTAQHLIPNDPANATANAKAAHQAVLDARALEAKAMAAFNVG